jgi:hypothetical protein
MPEKRQFFLQSGHCRSLFLVIDWDFLQKSWSAPEVLMGTARTPAFSSLV